MSGQIVGNTFSERFFIIGGRTNKGRLFLVDVTDLDKEFEYLPYPNRAMKFRTRDSLHDFIMAHKEKIRPDIRSVYTLKIRYETLVDEYNPEYMKGE